MLESKEYHSQQPQGIAEIGRGYRTLGEAGKKDVVPLVARRRLPELKTP
jgi:hypothetical protein